MTAPDLFTPHAWTAILELLNRLPASRSLAVLGTTDRHGQAVVVSFQRDRRGGSTRWLRARTLYTEWADEGRPAVTQVIYSR